MPTAIASANRNASSSGRESATLITKIETVSTPATFTRKREKPRSPSWNAVSAWRSPRPAAIAPNAVAGARRHDHALAGALVHDRAHEGTGRQVDRGVRAGDGLRRLGRRHRLAGEDRLVAFELVGPDEPQVGRDHVADPQRDDVAGHELG